MTTCETKQQLQHLTAEPGVSGSGMVRYAAAMFFFQAGQIAGTTLEIYRALAKNDDGDPHAVVKAAGGGKDLQQLLGRKVSNEKSK